MHRLCLVLILSLAVVCAAEVQSSSGSASGSSTPAAPPAGSAVSGSNSTTLGNATTTPSGTTTTGTQSNTVPNTAPATSGQQTPVAPGTTTTVNPGNPTAPSGGAPLVPGSAVPTADSNAAGSRTGVVGTTTSSPTGAVAPSIRLETQMPPPGASSTVTGVPAGVSSSGRAGQTSAPTTYTVPVLNSPRFEANPDPNAVADAVPNTADFAGMTYAGASVTGQGADNRSLAEIAAQYKKDRATQNARVITNEDIARLNARSDVSMTGAADNAALPQGEEAAQPRPAQRPKQQKRSPFAPKLPQ